MRASTRPSRASQTLAPVGIVTPQRVDRYHQRLLAARRFHLDRQRHVLAQKGRQWLWQCELDLDRAALRIDHRRDGQHAGLEALRRVGVGQHGGHLPGLELPQVAFVHLRYQLQRPGERQGEQRATGLHDLPRFDRAREHARIRRCGDDGLAQSDLGGLPGGNRECQLRLRLGNVGTPLGIGGALRAGTVQLRLRHRDRAAGLVETRRAQEALGHEIQRALQFGLRGQQHRLRLRHAGLRRAAPGASQARQSRGSLTFVGLSLRHGRPQLVALEPHEHIACLDQRPFDHRNLQHTPGERAAHFDTRRSRHASRELQGAYQRRHASADRRHQRGARRPPNSEDGEKDDREERGCESEPTRHCVNCCTRSAQAPSPPIRDDTAGLAGSSPTG